MSEYIYRQSGLSQSTEIDPYRETTAKSSLPNLAAYIRDLKENHETGITFVESDRKEQWISYDYLYHGSVTMLQQLNNSGLRSGDYLIIDLRNKFTFFMVFNACVLGGIIPAPIAEQSNYSEDDLDFQKTRNVFHDLGNPKIITDEHKIEKYQGSPYFSTFRSHFITPRDTQKYKSVPLSTAAVSSDDDCLIQYSSGSAGAPKGVRLTHTNILTNIRDMSEALDFSREDVGLSWMPHTHDMGLIGQYIAYIVNQSPQIHISPTTFIRKPTRFLELIEKHQVTITGLPNFAFKWLYSMANFSTLNKKTLRSLRTIVNGAEPISSDVLREFERTFEPFGLRPAAINPSYGMAEASVGVTFADHSKPYKTLNICRKSYKQNNTVTVLSPDNTDSATEAISLVSVGRPLSNMQIRIAHEKSSCKQELLIGEIQIRGHNVTQGYVNEKHSKNLFTESWLKTGDIGFMHSDELYVCGRSKDLIVINGKNYFSADLENQLQQRCALSGGSEVIVTSVPVNGTEQVLLFIKTKRIDRIFADYALLLQRTLEYILQAPVANTIPLKQVPKTTSGKVRRYRLRDEYQRDKFADALEQLDTLLQHFCENKLVIQPETENEKLLHSLWANALQTDSAQIGVTDSFFDHGGTSLLAVRLLSDIKRITGVDYGHGLLIENRTIREMSAAMESHTTPVIDTTSEQRPLKSDPGRSSDDDIAITGIGIRLPGASDATSLWNMFESGDSAIRSLSSARRVSLGLREGDTVNLGELANHDGLDYHKDQFKEEELIWTDPHQKLLLNCAQDALSDAGVLSDITGGNTGVYIGAGQSGFIDSVMSRLSSATNIPPNALVGSLLNTYAARISHLYDFKGPSMVCDTACSSGIVALHYALSDLQSGRVSSALVGGANLLLSPSQIALFNATGVMSKSGRCNVFGENADGIVIGEGAVTLHLETVASARARKRNIYSVIRACSLNNSGTTLGIMAPRPEGQVQVINQAFSQSGISPESIGYFEVHGTGTVLGDPIEINTLKNVFSTIGPDKSRIRLGSSKSNFGHLLAASGLLGLLRATLSLHNRKTPPCINIERLNPAIRLKESPFDISDTTQDWTSLSPRRACVNSFGFGGTNAHVILEESPY